MKKLNLPSRTGGASKTGAASTGFSNWGGITGSKIGCGDGSTSFIGGSESTSIKSLPIK